jgi:hypothetical protein
MAESRGTSLGPCIERFEDYIAALQIKVAVMEKLLLSSEELFYGYNQMVDELGIAYIREREDRQNIKDRKTLSHRLT